MCVCGIEMFEQARCIHVEQMYVKTGMCMYCVYYVRLPPHPMDTQLTESIRQLQQKIDMLVNDQIMSHCMSCV